MNTYNLSKITTNFSYLLILALITLATPIYTQTQIGVDIDGTTANDFSGWSVSLSADGQIVAISSPSHDSSKGQVRIYQNMAGTWTQIGADIDGTTAADQSGQSVSLSADGQIVAIGATGHDGNKGQVRVYQNMAGTWTQIGVDIDGTTASDLSGYSVSLSGDGQVVAIGARNHDGFKGQVRVYQNMAGTWTQIGVDIDGTAASDFSGNSVSLSGDGQVVAIGSINHDGDKGQVRVYQNMAGTWTQIGVDIDGTTTFDQSGFSVSLSADGQVVAIGARFHDGFKGQVRVYQNMAGTWTQIGVDIDGTTADDHSGFSVSLSADGQVVAIGTNRHDGNKGQVRVYQNMAGTWTQIGVDIDGTTADDFSGHSVSLSADGQVVAIGATRHDGFKGQVRVYSLAEFFSIIPTMGQWALMVLGLILSSIAVVMIRRRSTDAIAD